MKRHRKKISIPRPEVKTRGVMPPPTIRFKDKSKYSRKQKHKARHD